ncbi:MAG: ClbS/DfsB family four-helix bundle protein [Ruminococcus sp.]|jgi:hypothetical protein|nr:ClbS/DfsB family four-helix bundle protein [Ruminococcus sp.]
MPRPTTKEELLQAAKSGYEKLKSMLTEENKTFDPKISQAGKEAHWGRDKNVRDVLVHLYEWHELLLTWVSENMNGNMRPFLSEPYNWKNYGDMNVMFWERHQTTSYANSIKLFDDSHFRVMKLISDLSDEELFKKKHYNWTGTTSIGAYCISATSAHYDWAIKKLKKVSG